MTDVLPAGVCAVFVTAAFAFAGTELVGLAAAESKTPLTSLPSAVKQVFWRITLFYILALLFVGLMVRYDDPRLLSNKAFTDTKASPFVIAAVDAGLKGLDSFMNTVIMISVVSIANSAVYGGGRCLTAMAEHGYAPSIFAYVDRAGRPLTSSLLVFLFGLLAYIVLSADAVEVFDWLLALSGLSSLFTWGSVSRTFFSYSLFLVCRIPHIQKGCPRLTDYSSTDLCGPHPFPKCLEIPRPHPGRDPV